MLGIRRIEGEGAQGLGQAQVLLRIPAAGRLSLVVFAGDGRVQAIERIGRFHREIRAGSDHRALFQEALPRVSTLDAFVAHAILGHVHVGGGMGGLHRGDQLQRHEARDVLQRDDLRVLDAVAQSLGLRVAAVGRGEAVQHFAVGAVADRVDADLVALGERLVDLGRHGGRRHEQQAAVVRVVGVGLEHRGAAAAQRAVGEQLDRAHGEEVVAVADQRAVLADDVEGLAGIADHRVDARGQLVRVGVLPVEPVVVQIDAGIADAG